MSGPEIGTNFEQIKEDGIISPKEAKIILETAQGKETIKNPPISEEFVSLCCKDFLEKTDFEDLPNHHLKLYLPIFQKLSQLNLSKETKDKLIDIENRTEKKIFYTEIYPKLLPIAKAFEIDGPDDFFGLYKEIKGNEFKNIILNNSNYSLGYLDEVKKFIIDRPAHPLSQNLKLKSQENKDFIKFQLDTLVNTKNQDNINNLKIMLDNTNFMDINYLKVAIDNQSGQTQILLSLINQVSKSYKKRSRDIKSANLNGARFGSGRGRDKYPLLDQKFQNYDVNSVLDSRFDTDMNKLKQKIEKYKNNSISIIIPKQENSNLKSLVQDFVCQSFGRPACNEKVKIIESLDSKDIKIQTIEQKEINPSPVKIKLSNLPDNIIGNPDQIKKIISQNPEIQKISQDTNSRIDSLKIFGYASKNPTKYKSNPELKQYQSISDRIPENNTSVTNQLAIDPQDSKLTNNPILAFDRAATLYHNFPIKQKIGKNANIDISYGVKGPSREELIQKLGGNPSEEDLKKIFEENQYADIEIQYSTIQETTKEEIVVFDQDPIITKSSFDIFVYDGVPSTSKYRGGGGNGGNGGGGGGRGGSHSSGGDCSWTGSDIKRHQR